MVEAAICIEMLDDGFSQEQRILLVHQAGFRNIEFWDWQDKDLYSMHKHLSEHSMHVVNFSGHRHGDLIDDSTHQRIYDEIQQAIPVALSLGASRLMVLTNELGAQGKVVHPCDSIPYEVKRKNVIDGLRGILNLVPPEIMLVLEPLNIVEDHKDYFLSNFTSAVGIVSEIGNPRLKLLCDLYHQGMMGDDLEKLIRTNIREIGHFHIADYPGRNEPGTTDVAWAALLRIILESDYTGYVGFEYIPRGDSLESLLTIQKLWNDVSNSKIG